MDLLLACLCVYNCLMALEKEELLSAETISENMSFDHPEHVQELLLKLKTAYILVFVKHTPDLDTNLVY